MTGYAKEKKMGFSWRLLLMCPDHQDKTLVDHGKNEGCKELEIFRLHLPPR